MIYDGLLAIAGFLISATDLGKYFLPSHVTTKFYFFNLVESQQSLSKFSSDSFPFLRKFAYVRPRTQLLA